MLVGPLIEKLDMDQSGKDKTGLGRWTVMTLQGVGCQTGIVCGYNQCGNSKPDSGMVYQQHRRLFITQQKNTLCPQKLFREHLVAQLKKWRAEGDRLIICLNANKDICKKSIGKALTDTDGLSMKEIVGEFMGQEIRPTFFCGSKPINRVWAMADIEISNACVTPAGYGIGDHRMFIVDLVQSSMIGETPCQI